MTTTSCKPRLFLDIETFSSVDLTKSGVYPYAESPDFEVLLIAYAVDNEPIKAVGDSASDEWIHIKQMLTDPEYIKVAHNSAFERACLSKWLGIELNAEDWEDTMIMAAYNGLPLSLEGAGAALGITDQKMKEGTALINYFSKPCKPTIANGQRTRNLPHHAPEKWQTFIDYCVRDVEAMRQIYRKLESYPVTEFERRVWAVDARINERGVKVDLELAEAAIAVDKDFKAEHVDEMKRLTGLENPNSVSQLKEWLSACGVETEALNKATVAELRESVISPTVKRVLELRQLLSKTSTKKYQAVQNAVCSDGRVRGLLQYYGAARTGRWAGRLLQLQNLPQNHLDHIDLVREVVRSKDLQTLELLYDSVPDTLSQLIRTVLVAKEGCTFLVADYSAIEARVIAYLAGEQWRMDVFAKGGDIYCSSASQMFGVPVEKHGVNAHLRQKGKVAELACIAEGQKVLTDKGLVPIEDVTTDMKVWDGLEWVAHEGVIYKGIREVITYDGLTATPDHLVWIEGQSEPIQFEHAAACGSRLTETGAGRHAVRLGENHKPGETLERENESLLCTDRVHGLRVDTVAELEQSQLGKVERVPELLPTTKELPEMVIQEIYRGERSLHESERPKLQELRRPRYRVSFRQRAGGLRVHGRDSGAPEQRIRTRQNRRKRTLRKRQPALGYAPTELRESAPILRKVKVYDLVNVGPRHRFTVSGKLVHNCGYGGGVNALKAFGADKMGLTEEEMQDIVTQWRIASPTIPKLWRDTENAAKQALLHPGKSYKIPCGVIYYKDRDALRCKLPSGRLLTYWQAELDNDGKICFMGQNQTTRKWEKTGTWGGKLVENIVQAYARDCLAVALVRLDEAGYGIVSHVHDEIIAEAPEGSKWEAMAEIMSAPIPWAPGLKLDADGYETPFYRKD